MINKKTGEVKFPTWNDSLSRFTTREQFLSYEIVQDASIQVKNEPYCSWRLKPVLWEDNKWWTVVVYFEGGKLYQILLAASDSEMGVRWEDWSGEHEIEMLKYYKKLLTELLGFINVKLLKFSWGSADAFYDKKSGGSHILVKYKNI